MASVSITLRSQTGARMDSLAKFIADITMAAPVTERGSSAGTPAPELNGEGKAFFEAAHAFAEGIDGSATPSSAVIEGYLGLILAQLPRVLDSAAPDAEIEAAFQVVSSFVGSLATSTAADGVIAQVVSVLTSSPASRAALRLRILASLFSSCEEPSVKVDLLSSLFSFANASGQLSAIVSSLDAAPGWFKTWTLPNDIQCRLFLELASLYTTLGQTTKSFDSLVRYLTLAKPSEERNGVAVRAIAAVFSIPAHVIANNLADNKAVIALKDSPVHKAAFDLLANLLRPSVDEFALFAKSNAAYLTSTIGVTVDAAVDLVKVFALNNILTAAIDAQAPSVTYADIAEQLQISPDAVVSYVIRGADLSLFEAQLDELEQAVYPSRTTTLVFSVEAWEALQSRLLGMSKHIHELLDALNAEVEEGDE